MQSVQRSLNLLFQHTLFLMLPFFQKYRNPQVTTKKLANSVFYHPCPSRLASGIRPYFFNSLEFYSLQNACGIFWLVYSTMCGKKFSIYGVHIRKCIESMHFYWLPSSALRTPCTIFWKKSVSPQGQEQPGGGNYDLLYQNSIRKYEDDLED